MKAGVKFAETSLFKFFQEETSQVDWSSKEGLQLAKSGRMVGLVNSRPNHCVQLSDRYFMKNIDFYVQTRWGENVQRPSAERLQELIAELYSQGEEHAGAWMVDRGSEWSLRFDEDRFAYLEHGEDDAAAHLPRVTAEVALSLWLEFATGGRDAVTAYDWQEGPRVFTEQELSVRRENAERALLARDRIFYERLGPELDDAVCRKDECSRGRIQYSTFCRAHHFEQIFKRPCPFSD